MLASACETEWADGACQPVECSSAADGCPNPELLIGNANLTTLDCGVGGDACMEEAERDGAAIECRIPAVGFSWPNGNAGLVGADFISIGTDLVSGNGENKGQQLGINDCSLNASMELDKAEGNTPGDAFSTVFVSDERASRPGDVKARPSRPS